jgi:hypothetical protein
VKYWSVVFDEPDGDAYERIIAYAPTWIEAVAQVMAFVRARGARDGAAPGTFVVMGGDGAPTVWEIRGTAGVADTFDGAVDYDRGGTFDWTPEVVAAASPRTCEECGETSSLDAWRDGQAERDETKTWDCPVCERGEW